MIENEETAPHRPRRFTREITTFSVLVRHDTTGEGEVIHAPYRPDTHSTAAQVLSRIGRFLAPGWAAVIAVPHIRHIDTRTRARRDDQEESPEVSISERTPAIRIKASEFTVTCLPDGHPAQHEYSILVERDPHHPTLWRLHRPIGEYIADGGGRTRFDQATALHLAADLAPDLTVADTTARQILAAIPTQP